MSATQRGPADSAVPQRPTQHDTQNAKFSKSNYKNPQKIGCLGLVLVAVSLLAGLSDAAQNQAPSQKPVQEWNAEDVKTWVEANLTKKQARKIVKKNLNGAELQALDRPALKQMGVKGKDDVLTAIRDLKRQMSEIVEISDHTDETVSEHTEVTDLEPWQVMEQKYDELEKQEAIAKTELANILIFPGDDIRRAEQLEKNIKIIKHKMEVLIKQHHHNVGIGSGAGYQCQAHYLRRRLKSAALHRRAHLAYTAGVNPAMAELMVKCLDAKRD